MTTRSNSPYTPAFIKYSVLDSKPVQATYSDYNLTDSNHGSIDSFKYDPIGYPLKSTQQLNLDWSKFENHTFFSSAEVKVNEAFNKIINGYPFDGTKKEVEEFLDSLTGFEKWTFDKFPRWSGYLHFSGTQVGENGSNGTWISVKDKSGNLYPDLAKNNKGEVVINPPEDKSFTIEALVFLPSMVNDTQVIFQKKSSEIDGITFHLSPSTSLISSSAFFSVSSGSSRNNVSCNLAKGTFNHICLTINKNDQNSNLQIFVNEELVSESDTKINFKKLDIDDSNFIIGSGSSFYSKNDLVVPTQTFSGSIDELRIFHSVRDIKQQKLYASRGLYSTPELKLYYRFNEPSGSLSLNGDLGIDSIVLDSSGNSLHANINNYQFSLRKNAFQDTENVLKNELKDHQIVLFPAYHEITDFNTNLLISASDYDRYNPNNIIKLIPQHYLLEGASQEGFFNVEGNGGDPYGGEGIPGQGKRGSVQIILSFLYIWSKFFDEIKTYVDSFSTLRTVKYDLEETVPDNFLEDFVRNYGFYLPKFFNNAGLDQFVEGTNIDGIQDLDIPLKSIQSSILRRVLVSMPDIIRSKGTQHSIKSFLRSVGIDPENSLKIREYGGPTTKQLTSSREKRIESLAMLDFYKNSLVITSPLSASRIEPGYPIPAGNFYVDELGKNLGTDNPSDGLLTSGSWNIEAVFKIPPQKLSNITDPDGNQSLMRLIVTGSNSESKPGLIANVVATQFISHPETPAKVIAYIRPGQSNNSPLLELSLDLSGKGLFDGDKWNVSVGCSRNDEAGSLLSSSYYLRVGKTDSGDLSESYVTSSYFYEQETSEGNVFHQISSTLNSSGSYICIGSGQSIPTMSSYKFLNDSLHVDDIARTTDYVGWASNLRFWSKSMTVDEWKEHVRNPKSVGVENPLVNYNYVNSVSGSYQKLRLDTLQKQTERNSDNSGLITLLDFSMNNLTTYGIGFPPDTKILVGDMFNYSYLSPSFDEASTEDKIRIRSFENEDLLLENPWAVPAPSYSNKEIFLQEEPQDDLRLSIEFSMVDSLDKDMISMFSSLDVMNNMLGRPELMFSPDYPDLENMRDVYFNRLSDRPDFRKFLEFYRWFDVSISSFIEQLVPSKTNFKGSNFVVESHLLERHKTTYRHSNNYLGTKNIVQDSLLMQQIVGNLKKY